MSLKSSKLISKWRLFKKLDKDTGLAEKKYRDILLLNVDPDDEFNLKPPDANNKSLFFYFHKHLSQGSVARKNIMGDQKNQRHVQVRVDFAAEAIKHSYTVKEIVDYLNFTEGNVRKMIKKARGS